MTRQATPSDFQFIYSLYMHPTINPYLLYEFMDEVAFQPVFNALQEQKALYIFEHEGHQTGMFKLVQLAHRTAHIAYLGGVAIHPDFAGKGLGKKMFQEILELGQSLGLLRLELSTATDNARAIRLYESAGFEKEGVLRKYTWLKSENRFSDEVLMSYLYA